MNPQDCNLARLYSRHFSVDSITLFAQFAARVDAMVFTWLLIYKRVKPRFLLIAGQYYHKEQEGRLVVGFQ